MHATEDRRDAGQLKKGQKTPPGRVGCKEQLSLLWPVRGASETLCRRRRTNGERPSHEAPWTVANCKAGCSNCEHRSPPLVMLQGRCGAMRGNARQGTESHTDRHVERPCCFLGTRGGVLRQATIFMQAAMTVNETLDDFAQPCTSLCPPRPMCMAGTTGDHTTRGHNK